MTQYRKNKIIWVKGRLLGIVLRQHSGLWMCVFVYVFEDSTLNVILMLF